LTDLVEEIMDSFKSRELDTSARLSTYQPQLFVRKAKIYNVRGKDRAGFSTWHAQGRIDNTSVFRMQVILRTD
jgi:hypothetical protein